MDIALYEELGLSPNEAKIYHSLLTYGTLGVSTISLRAKVHRRNAYDALKRLHDKGLVFEVYGKGEILYSAVEPAKLMELVHERQQRLEHALPALQALFTGHKAPEQAYIYKGVEGVKNYLREALQAGQDLYVLGAEGAWFDPRVASYAKAFLAGAEKKGMKLHLLFDDDARGQPFMEHFKGHAFKFLPHMYDTNATLDVFGDYVVTYTGTSPGTLHDDVTIFVLYSPLLAESYRTWWRCLWDQLPAEKKRR